MEFIRLQYLFKRYDNDLLTGSEKKEFLEWLSDYGNREGALEFLELEIRETEQDASLDLGQWQKVIDHILERQQVPVRKILPWKRIAVAACIAVLLGVGFYFGFFHKTRPTELVKTDLPKDIEAPKITKAMITLSDGKTVALDSVVMGNLAQQEDVSIRKTSAGQIIYQGSADKEVYNTLTNPRGSTVINIILSDGSRVWLNAGSSVTYPVAFVGNERKVIITGEAYFEVTHNDAKSFYVSKGDMQVQVLGTHFNVNAYDDEADIKVTLLEGSIRVANKQGAAMIKPGEQVSVTADNKPQTLSNINVEQIMAWKNGLFSFNNADLPDVMRQLSRWYDIEVAYAGKIPGGRFKGEIPRDLTLSQLLNGLTSTRIHFKMEGNKKITILPE